MSQANLKKKILDLESELTALKKLATEKPDFSIDEKNWEKVKSKVKNTRKEIYNKNYGEE